MKPFKLLMFLFVGLIFMTVQSKGSPGEKMTFKPGIEFLQGYEVTPMDCFVADAPCIEFNAMHIFSSPLSSLTSCSNNHDTGKTYESAIGYSWRNYNDGYRYLDARKFLSRYARRH